MKYFVQCILPRVGYVTARVHNFLYKSLDPLYLFVQALKPMIIVTAK